MIIVIHENNEWVSPFTAAFEKLNFDYHIWYVPEMSLDLAALPTDAVYWNRMSASSHTRGHRYGDGRYHLEGECAGLVRGSVRR